MLALGEEVRSDTLTEGVGVMPSIPASRQMLWKARRKEQERRGV